MQEQVRVGVRVEVELRKKRYAGVIKTLHNNKPAAFDPKYILNVLDVEPIIHDEQLKLWQWIADYYLCTEGEVMAAALPAHFKLSSETILVYNEEIGEDFTTLDHDEYLVAEALLIRKELKLPEVVAFTARLNVRSQAVMQRLGMLNANEYKFTVPNIEANGFKVEDHVESDMASVKQKLGVAPRLASCHTGVIDGKFVEGHVPAAQVIELTKRDDLLGIAVPGMPAGSPGMEVDGVQHAYQVIGLTKTGSDQVVAEYPAQ